MREVIGHYKNGNYTVTILSDGTKIRYAQEGTEELIPRRPESMDICITKRCDAGCAFCHEAATKDGKHGEIMNAKFIDSLEPFTELAVGGGNALVHPNLIPFLEKCKERKLIVNMTVQQTHFMQSLEMLHDLCDRKLIFGLGVSLTYPTQDFIEAIRSFPNAVVHVIAGLATRTVLSPLYDQGIKLLILGYKQFRKGKTHYQSSTDAQVRIDCGINWLKENFLDLVHKFNVVSVDNLAVKQLSLVSKIPEEYMKRVYLGEDGRFTMYVDTVNQQYATSSTSPNKARHDYTDETITDMFKTIRKENGFKVWEE